MGPVCLRQCLFCNISWNRICMAMFIFISTLSFLSQSLIIFVILTSHDISLSWNLTEIKFDHFSVLLKIRSQAPVVGAHSVDLDHMSFLFSPVGDFSSSHAPVVGEHADRVLVTHRVAGGAGAEEGLVVVARQPGTWHQSWRHLAVFVKYFTQDCNSLKNIPNTRKIFQNILYHLASC